jgi:hypothetical protein
MDVTPDGRGVTNLTTEVVADCQPPIRLKFSITFTGVQPLDSNMSFVRDFKSTDLDRYVSGTFDSDGHVKGQLHVRANADYQGTRYACDSGGLTDYTATLGA